MSPSTPGPRLGRAVARLPRFDADRVALAYLVAAVTWIGLTTPLAAWLADATGLPVGAVELGKGIGFVVATAALLHAALRRHVRQVEAVTEAQAQVSERLREVERLRTSFLQAVSHELRTPLTSIVGYGLTVHNHAHRLDTTQLEQLTGRLVVNAERLERLVLDLLDVGPLGTGTPRVRREATDLDELVREVVGAFDAPGRQLDLDVEPVTVAADRDRVRRVVHELVRNSLRHTPAGTCTRVIVRRRDDHAVVTVEDDGPGIPAELAGTLFEPFAQGSHVETAPSPGIGIGLALVARCAQLHGGHAWAENVPDGGARFHVALPL